MDVNYASCDLAAAGHGLNHFAAAATDERWPGPARAALLALSRGKGRSESFGSGRRYTAPDGTVFVGHDTADGYRIRLID